MYAGKQVEKGGIWCCYFHRKSKIKLPANSSFPRCDFKGIKCDGPWFLVKEIEVKTMQEVHELRNQQRQQQVKMRGRDKNYFRKLKERKINKWDFEKW